MSDLARRRITRRKQTRPKSELANQVLGAPPPPFPGVLPELPEEEDDELELLEEEELEDEELLLDDEEDDELELLDEEDELLELLEEELELLDDELLELDDLVVTLIADVLALLLPATS